MRQLAQIKESKTMIITYFFINMILFFIIFYLCFFLSNQYKPFFELTKPFNDGDAYILNPTRIDKYVTDEDVKEAAFYYYDYLEKDGKYYTILRMNEKAKQIGIITQFEGTPIIIPLKDMNLKNDVVYTNNKLLEDSNHIYSNYVDKFELKNLVFNIQIEIDFLMIEEIPGNLNQATFVVFPKLAKSFEKMSELNSFYIDKFVATGEGIKNYILNQNKSMMQFILILTLIPLLCAVFTFYNFLSFYIRKNQDDIIINKIYYQPLKKAKLQYFIEILSIGIPSLLIGVLSAYIFSQIKYSYILVLSILVGILFYIVCTWFIVARLIKKIYKRNEWRELND